MPSPFPGMDPYLEPHWLDVHTTLVTEARRVLNRELPEDLVARSEERVAVESEVADDGPPGRIDPDVRSMAVIEVDAPYRLMPADDPIVERFVRILDVGGRLVTVVEFVSPTNKRQPGLDQFRRDRRDLLMAGVHVVEVDLVRAGNWRRLMWPQRCPPGAEAVYRAIVWTGGDATGHLFPIPLRSPLPTVPIPLRPGDAKVVLPLQDLLDATYDDGKYRRTVDYTRPPDPPLDADDAAWAAGLLAGRAPAT